MMVRGKIIYDFMTNKYSTGWWIHDSQGNWCPIWQGGE